MAGVSAARPLRVPLFRASTTAANGTSHWIKVQGYSYLTVYLTTHGNPGAGTCVIEEADYDPDVDMAPGFTASTITTVDVDASVGTDGQYAYHLPVAAYSYVRARIGTTVTVATLDGTLVGN